MAATIVRVSDTMTRDQLAEAIKAQRVNQSRMPAHWTERREDVAVEIEALVNRWLAGGEC